MYPELELRLETLFSGTSESDQHEIEMILSFNPDLIIEKLKDSHFKLRYQLSIKVLLSQKFEDLSSQNIYIKFRCLKNLRNEINSELLEMEIRNILNRIEDLIFEKNSQNFDEILAVRSNIRMIANLLTSTENRFLYIKRLLEIYNLKNDLDKIKRMIEQNDKKEIILDFIFIKFKEKLRIIEKLTTYFADLGYLEISNDLNAFINRLKPNDTIKIIDERSIKHQVNDVQAFSEVIDNEQTLRLAKKLDNTILQIVSTKTLPQIDVTIPDETEDYFPNYDTKVFEFEEERGLFEYCATRFLLYTTGNFEFEVLFVCVIKEFLIQFSDKLFFDLFLNTIHYRNTRNKFFEFLYQMLKSLPDVIKEAIAELCFLIYDKDKALNILDFLFHIVMLSKTESVFLIYKPLEANKASHFRMLLDRHLIKNILAMFDNNTIDLDSKLSNAIQSVIITELPERITGMTLKSLAIVIKDFKSSVRNLVTGATFVVLLHELVHYLQRTNHKTFQEPMKQFSPEIKNKNNTKAGGYILEEELFGETLKYITLEQSNFLLEGNYPEKLKKFQKRFRKFGIVSESNPSLPLLRKSHEIYFGRCGSVFNGLQFINS